MYSHMILTFRDMFTVVAITLLGLVSVCRSAPLACEDSVRPLDELDPHHLEGRWALIAGSLSVPAHLEFFKQRDSTSVNFSNTSANSTIFYTPTVLAGGKCHIQTYNVSVEGSILNFDKMEQVNLTVTFIYTTCQDCLLMRFDNESKILMRLLLFSKRRELEQKEMEAFRAQVECLNIPPPAVMDPTKELCPVLSIGDSVPAQTDGQ